MVSNYQPYDGLSHVVQSAPEQLRHIGARGGGRARARNWRLRQRAAGAAGLPTPRPTWPPVETTAPRAATLHDVWGSLTSIPAARREWKVSARGPRLFGVDPNFETTS